jgi:hypothetical protein
MLKILITRIIVKSKLCVAVSPEFILGKVEDVFNPPFHDSSLLPAIISA